MLASMYPGSDAPNLSLRPMESTDGGTSYSGVNGIKHYHRPIAMLLETRQQYYTHRPLDIAKDGQTDIFPSGGNPLRRYSS